ncbi:oligopeptide transport system substrate-binding protein [Ereboglobus sp. PH5-10]|uniref:peptide ABC transporter substrate-binding protein n=1 Tax=Ereboglobus sp. PH5-10 TaxID=2940629 RepID=UPI002404E200|nr:peptide ABC transporter substrate-binding protein [Ereboglobus sp. PH5-10]MDF9826766.1 oligopeptide transport system substrate-binding protein [Ereboglobus sp. PH5-10]
MAHRIFQRIFCAAAALGVFALGSCFQRERAIDSGNREQVLHRGAGPEIATLDPHLATGTSEYNILSALLEGLVTENPVDLSPEPGVAESWNVSRDGLAYTFLLRDNARWSNGDPVTAGDFVASFKRMLSPSLAADYAHFLYIIQNAEAYHKGHLEDFAQVGAVAVNERTLKITLEHPCANFLSMLNHTAFFPVHARSIEAHGALADRKTDWARPGRFVGNGAFVLKEWRHGQRISVEKSPTYWDAENVRLNGVVFYSFESRDAEERAFRAGQLHLTEALSPSKIDAYRRNSPGLLRVDPYLGTEFYRINTERPFLNDARVRRALSLAVDRKLIAAQILRGVQSPAYEFVPPDALARADGKPAPGALRHDANAARALLAEAGYPEGKGAPPVELLFNTSESHRAVAEAVQEMWRRELGLSVTLVNQENKTVLGARRARDYQVLRSAWMADYADALSFLEVWESSSGNNHTGWSDAAFDQLLYQAARTADKQARAVLLQKAEAILLGQSPMIPLYHYSHVFLIRPSVRNWHPTLLDHHPYKAVWLEAD